MHTILPKKQQQRLRNLRVVVRCVATLMPDTAKIAYASDADHTDAVNRVEYLAT
jgi:hypothetical protein